MNPAKPWFIAVVSNAVIGASLMASWIIVARSLGPSGRGVVAEAMLWPGLVLVVGGWVGTQNVVYFWSKALLRGDTRSVLGVTLLLSTALGVALFVTSITVNYLVLGLRGRDSLSLANLYSLTLPMSMLLAAMLPTWLAEQRYYRYWIGKMSQPVMYLLSVVVLSLLGYTSARSFVMAFIVSSLIQLIGVLLVLSKSISLAFHWNRSLASSIVTFGILANLAGLPYFINARLDQMMMSLFLESRVLGYYAVAVAWSSAVSFLGVGASTVMLARSAKTEERDRESGVKLLSSFRVISSALLALGTFNALIAPVAIPRIFGTEYAPSVWPAVILSFAGAVLTSNLMLHELLRGRGHLMPGVRAEATGLVLTVTLLIALLPRLEAIGAAVTSLVAYSVVFTMLVRRTRYLFDVRWTDCVGLQRADIASIRGLLMASDLGRRAQQAKNAGLLKWKKTW